jgi:hypothetical protein
MVPKVFLRIKNSHQMSNAKLSVNEGHSLHYLLILSKPLIHNPFYSTRFLKF